MDKIIIGDKIINPTNKYKFVFDWMHGDADGYSSTEVLVKEDSKFLHRFLKYISNFDQISNRQRSEVPHWLREEIHFFSYGQYDETSDPEQWLDFVFNYETDHTGSNGEFYAAFEKLELTYFDENGIEYHGFIVKKE